MTVWRITTDNGILRVQRGVRTLPGEYRNEPDALKYIDGQKSAGDKIVRVDDDGYETPVRRRRWRSTGE